MDRTASSNIGPNHPCQCGSGKKHKKCCGREFVGNASNLDLRDRNLILLNAIPEIFGLKHGFDWRNLKKNLSGHKVRQLYELIAKLWPKDTDVASLLPRPGDALRALYLGDARPEAVVRNIVRFGLYADEVLVVSPFHNPWNRRDEYNPLVDPDQWKTDTLKLILYAGALDPWMRAGLVTMIPDPGQFDVSLLFKTAELAEKRLGDFEISESDMRDASVFEVQHEMFLTFPAEYHAEQIRKEMPHLSEAEVGSLVAHIVEERHNHPLVLDQTLDKSGRQMNVFRTGANLEMALYISQLTGSFPFTNLSMRWRELLSIQQELPEGARLWTPLTNAFQKLKFNFLDEVDPRFALEMRKDGRLHSFRTFLRKLWKQNQGGTAISVDNMADVSRDYCDELDSEYQKAKSDWDAIDRDLLKWMGTTMAGALATGVFSLALPSAGFGIGAITALVEAHRKRGEFRKRVPMSVFIDLERK